MSVKVLLVANTDWYLYRFRMGLARFLQEKGWEAVMVSPAGEYTQAIAQAGFRHIVWHVSRRGINPFQEIVSVLALRRIFEREHPAIVHLHTIKPVLYGALASQGLPLATMGAVTGRGYLFLSEDRTARILRSIVLRVYRQAARRLHKVVFENSTDRDFFLEHHLVSPQQSALLPGVGVDIEKFSPLPEPQGPPTVLFAGRMLWDKGVGEFVAAATSLAQRAPDARFVLVGAPDDGNPASVPEATLRSWVQRGVVEWWGWQQDMRRVFAQAHVVVLPSLGEGVPTVLLEAAACARPLVATEVPGCTEVVQQGVNGFLVPPRDPAALAEAIYQLLGDADLRRRMGIAGRKLVEQRFSRAIVHERTWRLYQEILPLQ